MKAGIAQIRCDQGDISSNCAKIPVFCDKARSRGINFLVFPEMMDTGFDMPSVKKYASKTDGLPYVVARESARNYGLFLVCGFSEKTDNRIFNTLWVFGPNGDILGHYRKINLFTPSPVEEDKVISQGKELLILPYHSIYMGFMICYDLRFPELSISMAQKNASVIFTIAAWPKVREKHFKILTQARALDAQAFIVAANQCGTLKESSFCGQSRIIDPQGNILAEASDNEETLIEATLDFELVVKTRSGIPLLKNDRIFF